MSRMSLAQAAAYCGKHPATIRNWITKGLNGVWLKGALVGGTWRTSEDDLLDFFRQCAEAKLGKADAPAPASPRERQQRYEAAMQRLKEKGVVA